MYGDRWRIHLRFPTTNPLKRKQCRNSGLVLCPKIMKNNNASNMRKKSTKKSTKNWNKTQKFIKRRIVYFYSVSWTKPFFLSFWSFWTFVFDVTGAGESGKSTVVKQMKILHNPFTTQLVLFFSMKTKPNNYFLFSREKLDKIPDIKRNIRDSLTVSFFNIEKRLKNSTKSFSEYFTRFWQHQSADWIRKCRKSNARSFYSNYCTSIGFWLSTGIFRTRGHFMERRRCSGVFWTIEWISIDRLCQIVRFQIQREKQRPKKMFSFLQFSRSGRRNSETELRSQRSSSTDYNKAFHVVYRYL